MMDRICVGHRSSSTAVTPLWVAYLQLMRLDRPVGIILLLYPTVWALWIASVGHLDLWITLIFVLGVVVMRSLGCVINDIADRHFDPYVTRTALRPLATGRLKLSQAFGLCLVLGGLAFILLMGLIIISGWNILWHAGVALGLGLLYPYCKRWISMPQWILGLAFSYSIIMVFVVYQRPLWPVGVVLFSINAIWAVIYDSYYAIADREEDRALGLYSTVIAWGDHFDQIILILTIFWFSLLILLGWILNMQKAYYLSLVLVVFFLKTHYQQYQAYQKGRDDQGAGVGTVIFLNHQWVGFWITVGLILGLRV